VALFQDVRLVGIADVQGTNLNFRFGAILLKNSDLFAAICRFLFGF
jgi:hypothetical protein